MGKQIQIRILPNGKVESRTINIKGKTCLNYVEPLEALLDAKIVDSEFTNEYYESNNIIVDSENAKIKI